MEGPELKFVSYQTLKQAVIGRNLTDKKGGKGGRGDFLSRCQIDP